MIYNKYKYELSGEEISDRDLLTKLIKENTMYKYIWKLYASENIITLNHDEKQTHIKKHIDTDEIFQEKIKKTDKFLTNYSIAVNEYINNFH